MDTKPTSLVKNGGILKIPVGFRFHPTDEELVVHYLKRKVHSLPLPAAVIPELADVFHYNPWDLPGWLDFTIYISLLAGIFLKTEIN